jgi:hypothetical protein
MLDGIPNHFGVSQRRVLAPEALGAAKEARR